MVRHRIGDREIPGSNLAWYQFFCFLAIKFSFLQNSENLSSICASEYVLKQTGVADSQGLGKQVKHNKKLKFFVLFTKYPSASVNVLTLG